MTYARRLLGVLLVGGALSLTACSGRETDGRLGPRIFRGESVEGKAASGKVKKDRKENKSQGKKKGHRKGKGNPQG